MPWSPSWLLQTSRTFMNRLFLRFGLHCATHQIRVILISCVVITSLLYPALALYSSSLPNSSFSILDAFALDSTSLHVHQDLVNVWNNHKSLRVPEDAVSRARCGVGRVVRVERILVRLEGEDDAALDRQLLLSTLDFEEKVDKLLIDRSIPCIRGTDGRCFVLSPMAFWGHDRDGLLKDDEFIDTLTRSGNISVSGVPVTPQMVLAGRGSDDPHSGIGVFDYATFLSLTYFFPGEADCSGTTERLPWLQVVEDASAGNAEDIKPQEPTLIPLEYDESQSKKKDLLAFSTFLYIVYAFFVVYVSWSMRRMTAVHSRAGLILTALVEIAASTITSLSVCALAGFKVTMVPWELLPILIVFVGAENMINLVDAVTKTPITLSVKQRTAEGLSHAGTSNTLKVVSYNAILGIIAVFSFGAIRQFCAFAVVVLVAHWFLAHTFFTAVLSIDIQRLELEELLRQDTNSTPLIPHAKPQAGNRTPQSAWNTVQSKRKQLSGRAAKNLSLILLLAITGALYYTTLPGSSGHHDLGRTNRALSKNRASNTSIPHIHDPARQLWKTLNPTEEKTLHLRVEMPSTVTFRPQGQDRHVEAAHRSKLAVRAFRTLVWTIKTLVFPIVATTCAVWVWLLYLLKNTELLEAQRNKAGSETPVSDQENSSSLDDQVAFSTLPRAYESDIELIAVSRDGPVVVTVGLQNELVIWNTNNGSHLSIDATNVLSRAANIPASSTSLTCVAVDDTGRFIAAGTVGGVLALWKIQNTSILMLPPLSLNNSSASVLDIQFTSTSTSSNSTTTAHSLIAAYEGGLAVQWSLNAFGAWNLLVSSRDVPIDRVLLVRMKPDDSVVVAFCGRDGGVELQELGSKRAFHIEQALLAGSSVDMVAKVHIWQSSIGGGTRVIVAAATVAGLITLWDASTGEYVVTLDDAFGPVGQLYLTEVPQETCHFCGHPPVDSFGVVFSVENVVKLYQIFLPDEQRRCSCTPTLPKRMPSFDNLARRSRRNSIASASSSPQMHLARNRISSPVENAAPFPVSGHGIHSRRASEKESRYRASEMSLSLPDDTDSTYSGVLERIKPPVPSPFWQKMQVVRVIELPCDRGGWGVAAGKVVGIRRCPRHGLSSRKSKTFSLSNETQGLSLATLERWEVWTFDLSSSRLQSSPLSSLITEDSGYGKSDVPRLPFTRASPLVVSPSRTLAGFGNTLGLLKFADK